MKNLITIGLPSKGRLKEKAVAFFSDRDLKVLQSKKKRNYFVLESSLNDNDLEKKIFKIVCKYLKIK